MILVSFLVFASALNPCLGEEIKSPLFVEGKTQNHGFATTALGYGALSEDLSHVSAYFSGADSSHLKIGSSARVQLMPTESTPIGVVGRVTSILRNADPKTGQSIVTVSIPAQELSPRSYASVSITLSSRTAIALPTTAIIIDDGKTFVYRKEPDGGYEKTQVEVGNLEPDFTEIKSGIDSKDTILIKGALEWSRKDITGDDD